MRIIGVAGASASGKTEFCEIVARSVTGKTVAVISLDCFYKGIPQGIDPHNYNFDHPSAFNIELLLTIIKSLKEGHSVNIPIYDFINHCPKKETTSINPTDIIIIEGILSFYWKELRNLMDFKIFISTDLDLCLIRRLLRDTVKRGRTYHQVIEQYQKFVRTSYLRYIRDTCEYANIILPNNKDEENFQIGIDCILKKIEHC